MNRAERRQQKKLAQQAAKKAKQQGFSLPVDGSVAPPPSANVDAMMQQAIQAQQNGQLDQADTLYRQILTINPAHFDAMHLSGVLAHQMGRSDEAVAKISTAIELNPNVADARKNLAAVFAALGRHEEAEASLEKAVSLNPASPDMHFNLANARLQSEKLEEAAASYRKTLELQPDHLIAQLNLTNVLRDLEELDEAEEVGRGLLSKAPNAWEAQNSLGSILLDKGQLQEALCHFEAAAVTSPNSATVLNNKAIVYAELGRYQEAQSAFETVVSQVPELHDAHVMLGLLYLRQGRYAEGWRELSHRRSRPKGVLRQRAYDAPVWDGSDLSGKRIFVYPEQGIGDFIQFVRHIPQLIANGGEVVLEVPPSVASLFPDGWQGATCIAPADGPGSFDCHASVMDLPGLLKLDEADFAPTMPYIKAEPDTVAEWDERLGAKSGLRVGVVWAGNAKHKNDHNRSIPLETFAGIFDVEGVQFFSLQVGQSSEALAKQGGDVIDLQNDLTDFGQTAAVMANLDLIVTVDTSVAHLAGALGREVWTLLPHVADWRWGIAREDTPWYPCMRLFRQGDDSRWSPVLQRVREALKQLAP